MQIEDVMQDGFDLELSAIMENKQKIAPFLRELHWKEATLILQ